MTESDNSTPFLAGDYDLQIPSVMPYYSSFHIETINLIKAMHIEPKNWLDTGCGTGVFVEKVINAFHNTRFVLADPSSGMLSVARKRLSKYSDMVQFLEPVSTQDLPRLAEKFDVVTAILSHHYLSCVDRANATKVCFEILANKGVYINFENIMPLTDVGIVIGKENWKNFELNNSRSAKAADEHVDRFNVDYFPIRVGDHLLLLKEVGFSTVEMLWYSYLQAGFYSIK